MSRTCTLVPESQLKPPPTPGLFKTDFPGSESRRNSISRRAPSPKVKEKQQCPQQAMDGKADSPQCSPHFSNRRTYIQPAHSVSAAATPAAAAVAAAATAGEAHQFSAAAATRAPGLKAVDQRPRSIRPAPVRGCSGTAAARPTGESPPWQVVVAICPAKPTVTSVVPYLLPSGGGAVGSGHNGPSKGRPMMQRVQEPRHLCRSANTQPEQHSAAATGAPPPSVSGRQFTGVPPNLGMRASTTMRTRPITMAGVGVQMPVTPLGVGMQRQLTPHMR